MTEIPESAYSLDADEIDPRIIERAFESGNYPYAKKIKTKVYERELELLQIELLKLQTWARETGTRMILIFEGRDAAGKGGTIKRFMEHLNPRHAHVVALSKPTDTERGQWYFQRYINHFPTNGDMVLFDRSWYNRAGVERVMGFCDEADVTAFFSQTPRFEELLVESGTHMFKFWLTVGREEQFRRFHGRKNDPLKRWKLSPIDYASLSKWHEYTAARQEMFEQTHTETAPWTIIRSNDKKRARLNAIRAVLTQFEYADKDHNVVGSVDDQIVHSGLDEF